MFEKVCQVIADTLSCDINDLEPETTLMEDLGADSLDAVELNMALEEIFDVQISDEELAKLKSVQDIVDSINAHKE